MRDFFYHDLRASYYRE